MIIYCFGAVTPPTSHIDACGAFLPRSLNVGKWLTCHIHKHNLRDLRIVVCRNQLGIVREFFGHSSLVHYFRRKLHGLVRRQRSFSATPLLVDIQRFQVACGLCPVKLFHLANITTLLVPLFRSSAMYALDTTMLG